MRTDDQKREQGSPQIVNFDERGTRTSCSTIYSLSHLWHRNHQPPLPEPLLRADRQVPNPECTHTVTSTVTAQLGSFAYLKTYIAAMTWDSFRNRRW